MDEILKDLNGEAGVKGSMVVTHDGIVVASALGVGLQGDLVAAMAAHAILSLITAFKRIGQTRFSRFILKSSYGKMVFVDAGIAYLVVVLDRHINLDATLITISGAAHKIQTQGQIAI